MILLAIFCLKVEGVSIVRDKFSNDIVGISWTPKKDFTIEIYSKGQEYYGKLVWLKSSRGDTTSLEATSLKLSEYVGIPVFSPRKNLK